MRTFMIRGAPVGAIAILLAIFASVGGFIFGYDTGQISDFQVMDDFKRRFASCTDRSDASTCHFSNVRTGLIVAMLSIGCLFGALVGASIADRVGRRRAVSINCAIIVVGSLIQVTSFHSWVQFMIARIITGVGIGALSAVVPLYQAETAPKEIRGMAYCIAIGTRPLKHSAASGSWRVVLALNMLWALILGIGIFFAPESPRWLMANGYPEQAEAALARIRGVQVADNDFTVRQSFFEIQEAVRQEEAMDKFTWWECFHKKDKILYRTLLMMLLQSLQQLTGVSTYITPPFAKSISHLTPHPPGQFYGFIFAACNLFGAAVVYFFVYESSGLSLEAVDQMYNDPKVRPWNSSRWVPPGHESRADYQQALEAEKKASALKAVQHRELAEDGSHSTHSDHANEKRAPEATS
ncbi:hypothetical protein P7C70_g5930, partial [Phenoliferia sp. Uapishka_3]